MHKSALVIALGRRLPAAWGRRRRRSRAPSPSIAVCAVRTGAGKSQTTRTIQTMLREAGQEGRLDPPPHAVRRPRQAARAALRHHRGPGEARVHHRGDGGVRAAHHGRQRDLRRRRLRGDPARGREGGRRHPLGRRQQRLPLLPGRPLRSRSPTRTAPATSCATTPARPTCDSPTSSSSTRSTPPTAPASRPSWPTCARSTRTRPSSMAASPVTVDEPELIKGKRVLVVEDGPTLTHGEMKYGAGTVAAAQLRRGRVRRPAAVRGGRDQGDLREVPQHRRPAAGHGLRRPAAQGPGGRRSTRRAPRWS